MTFEEYKTAVEKELLKREPLLVKQDPQRFKRAFDEEIEELFTDECSIETAVWFIGLMI